MMVPTDFSILILSKQINLSGFYEKLPRTDPQGPHITGIISPNISVSWTRSKLRKVVPQSTSRFNAKIVVAYFSALVTIKQINLAGSYEKWLRTDSQGSHITGMISPYIRVGGIRSRPQAPKGMWRCIKIWETYANHGTLRIIYSNLRSQK